MALSHLCVHIGGRGSVCAVVCTAVRFARCVCRCACPSRIAFYVITQHAERGGGAGGQRSSNVSSSSSLCCSCCCVCVHCAKVHSRDTTFKHRHHNTLTQKHRRMQKVSAFVAIACVLFATLLHALALCAMQTRCKQTHKVIGTHIVQHSVATTLL